MDLLTLQDRFSQRQEIQQTAIAPEQNINWLKELFKSQPFKSAGFTSAASITSTLAIAMGRFSSMENQVSDNFKTSRHVMVSCVAGSFSYN